MRGGTNKSQPYFVAIMPFGNNKLNYYFHRPVIVLMLKTKTIISRLTFLIYNVVPVSIICQLLANQSLEQLNIILSLDMSLKKRRTLYFLSLICVFVLCLYKLTRPAWAGFRYCGTTLLLQFWVKFRDC